MPIVTPKTISINEKRRLVGILAEMKARNLPIPAMELPKTLNEIGWRTDENGYFKKEDGTQFKPRPELEAFINSKARFALLRSGRGGGKTVAGAQKALRKIRQGESGAVMNPDFENFRTSTWLELREWIPWHMVVPKHRYRKQASWEPIRPFTIVFMNGAQLYCKGLKDPESARGANLNFFWYDEGRRDPTGMGWNNAVAFTRVGKNPQAWCTTTPAYSQHWTTTFFNGKVTDELRKVLRDLGIENAEDLFEVHVTSPLKNAGNLDEFYYAALLAANPSGYLRAREVDGMVADEGGSLGDRTWFDNKILDVRPDWIVKQVRFWDLAATEEKMTITTTGKKKKNDPDETMGTLLGTDSETAHEKKRFCAQDQTGGRWLWHTIKKMIVDVARQDGQEVAICFEQEPASGGKNQVAELKEVIQKELPGWMVYSIEAKKLGDRVLAANTWFGEAANGQWYMVKGLWNEPFLEQLDLFPNAAVHDDRVTSATGARHYIAPIRKWSKMGSTTLDLNSP